MSQTISCPPPSVKDPILSSDIRRALMEDDSPFGVQGLARDSLKILRPDCIGSLAATLALSGTPEQIRDPKFVAQILARREQWQEEFRVIHLIERSLWIDGHCDLVMTLVHNPSRILDNPPAKITEALSLAIELHPKSTVWYGVPLFGDQLNAEGLPIPLTASEVRAEAERRIAAAQQHALRWRWAYRAGLQAARVPSRMWRFGLGCARRVQQAGQGGVKYWRRARRDARNRTRARILAQSEYCKMGRSVTNLPAHTTMLGRVTERTSDSIRNAQEAVSDRFSILEGVAGVAPFVTGAAPVVEGMMLVSSLLPMLMTPLPIIACDPFLFVELPDEPGKLRFLGHWYWQGQPRGRKKLHLHASL